MTMKNSTKYGIIFVGLFFLLALIALGLPNFSENNIKPASNGDKPINITISSLVVACTHEDLNNYSDTIVTGTVKQILPSKWNTLDGKRPSKDNVKVDQSSFIYTDIVLSVDKYLKKPSESKESKEIIVRIVGGTIGADRVISEDEPSFKTGEKVLLYLTKDTINVDSEHYLVTGSDQGKFILTDDGKAVRPDETVSQEELLSTIENK
jgi:hypothetical protein